MMDEKTLHRKEFAERLAEYVNLHIESGPVLFNNETIYANIGCFLDEVKDAKRYLGNNIKLISIETKIDDTGYETYYIKAKAEGVVRTATLQTRIFSTNQVHTLCDKIEYILNNAA